MKAKKTLAALLAGLLAVSVCACSSGSDSPSSQPAASSGGNAGAAASSEAPASSGKRGKISVTVYDRGNVPTSEGTIENNRWTKWINENGPVDVEFVAIPRTGSGDKLNVLFASGDAPDLIFEYAPTVKTPLYQQKQLMPIKDMIENYSTTYKALMEKYPDLEKAGTMDDGQLYQFGRIQRIIPKRCVAIRKDWLEKLNLEAPKTLDDYYNVMKAFVTQDPDGNGQDDTYGMAISYRASETFDQMIPGWEIGYTEDGQWQYTWDRLQTRLEFKKKLYDENIIDKEFMTDKNGARATQDFVTGKTGIYPWLVTFEQFLKTEYKTLKENVPEAEIMFIPYPETPWGVTYIPTLQNPVQMTAVVNAACKDPESVMKYVDFVSSKEFAQTLKYGFEGEHYNLVDGKAVTINQDQYNNEVAYNIDFQMLTYDADWLDLQPAFAGFKLDDPFEKEGWELYKQAMNTYLDPNGVYADFTISEHMPQLPKDVQDIRSNISLSDFYDKAVVSGNEYTVEQAISDAKAAWEKGGGDQVLQWYQNWLENESANAFSAKDAIALMVDQNYVGQLAAEDQKVQ
ncbi:MAG: extracellular solute-binding protein [Provencibacterium sp.]|jgi:putative aldouronate transport system substrate-binding protein|nr:extracellular solute-binding protein [Provencibacterium sp.]